MEGQKEYDILKLVESQGRCYVSSACVQGITLASYLKFHPDLPKDQLLDWMRQILQQLDMFHRCRGNPCYQYVNPYSMIVGEEGTIHFADLGSTAQETLRRKLERRSIRESFLMSDNQYYQRASLADDLYGIGRTFQYMLAAAESVPPVKGREKRKIKRMIYQCLHQHPDPEKKGKWHRQYQTIQDISDQFPRKRKKTKYKRRLLQVCIVLLFLTGAAIWITAMRSGSSGESDIKQAETQKTEAELSTSKENELLFQAGMSYFLELEQYKESERCFRQIEDRDFLAEKYRELSACLLHPENLDEQKLEKLLDQIEKHIPDKKDYRYYLSLLRGYALLTTYQSAEARIRLGTYCLECPGWKVSDKGHEKEKEIRWNLVEAMETMERFEDAASQYDKLLELEENPDLREQIYLRAILNDENVQNMEEAWSTCRKGIEELPDSEKLKILYIEMQCRSEVVDSQTCAQTIRSFLEETPQIAQNPDFLKLQEDYGIQIEGQEVKVGEKQES